MSSALARAVMMLSTRPAVARSSGGKSPNSQLTRLLRRVLEQHSAT